MEITQHYFKNSDDINLILGQSHFIKTVEDLVEIIVTTVPKAKFAVAFCEASGPALIRYEGNEPELIKTAVAMMEKIKAGHSFAVLLKECYPINVLSKIKNCDEVVNIFCATANPITVLTVENIEGAGIIGVIDGLSPKGVENDSDKKTRKDFLRKIGYKY